MSDKAILISLGKFIKENRIRQNKTQAEIARIAGISRMSISFLENGDNCSLLTYISLLRALNLLNKLDIFESEQLISPLQLARFEKSKRRRASGSSSKPGKPKSDW
jgi:transcriptional regulator with XRE-family HTH domain